MKYTLYKKFFSLQNNILNKFTGKFLWKSENEFENLLNEAWIEKNINLGSFNHITMERMDAEEFDYIALYAIEYRLLKYLSESSEYVNLHNYYIIRLLEKLLRVNYNYSVTSKSEEILVNGSKRHFFHIVDPSPWAYCVSVGLFSLLTSFSSRFNDPTDWMNNYYLLFSLIFIIISVVGWFCVIVDEATFKGHHTMVVRHGLILGFKLFIVSEIMLLFGFFWAFFHAALSPSMEVGFLIPATGVKTIPYSGVPFYNTLLLCCSGLSISQAHWGMELGRFKETVDGLIVTIFLGSIFSLLQVNEYRECMYNISDGAFPSALYPLTGLHGTHVFTGLLSLTVSMIRIFKGHFTAKHHLGFLFAIWYWHFVDIVWIIVYLSVHVWISNSLLLFPLILCFILIISYVYLNVYYIGNPLARDYTYTDSVFNYVIRDSAKGIFGNEISEKKISEDTISAEDKKEQKKIGIFEIRVLTNNEKLLVAESDKYDWEIIDTDAFERLVESQYPKFLPAHWFEHHEVKLLDEETVHKLYRNEWEEEDEEDIIEELEDDDNNYYKPVDIYKSGKKLEHEISINVEENIEELKDKDKGEK